MLAWAQVVRLMASCWSRLADAVCLSELILKFLQSYTTSYVMPLECTPIPGHGICIADTINEPQDSIPNGIIARKSLPLYTSPVLKALIVHKCILSRG